MSLVAYSIYPNFIFICVENSFKYNIVVKFKSYADSIVE